MNAKTAGYLILYGCFLFLMGLLGYLSNPEKAKTALISGGIFGSLSILWGVLGARGFRWSLPAAVSTTVLLIFAFSWRASAGWMAISEGDNEKLFAAILISLMLIASVLMMPILIRGRAPEPTGSDGR